jgi:hypothetical protein
VPIDVLASAPHYADHLAAVFGALPQEARGEFLATGPDVANRIRALGFDPSTRSTSDNPVLVAAYGDLGRARLGMRRARLAIMEHGAGQSYGGRPMSGHHGSYAGGRGREAASLFLHPGEHPAARDRKCYPRSRVEVIGSPYLDTLPAREGEPDRVVAFSFHFNAGVAPEAKTAYPWIFPAVLELREKFALLGHAHPRFFPVVARRYKAAGIEAVPDFRDVCRRADVYVCDNSSTLFAFAATGRPVVVLNPPWYDKRISHGLRFWEAASVGVNCDNPADLEACITEALRDRVAARKRREAALDLVYAYRTGASQRAADILQEWAA